MKRITSILLTLLILISLLPTVSRAAEDKVYYVGDDIAVTINASAKTLTVSGSGPLPDYSTASYAPWYADPLSETVIIEDGITEVGSRCFSGNKYTKRVVIGDSVRRIGVSAFSNNTALAHVSLPCELKRIESYAFYYAPVSSVSFPDGLEYIGPCAFDHCKSLTGFTLPDGLQYLDATAFTATKYYSSLPNGVNALNGFTMKYKGSTIPQTVTFPEDTRVVSTNTLVDSTAVTEVVLPDGVERIFDRGLYNLSNLKSIIVPDSVTEIGAFGIGYRIDSDYDTPIAIKNFTIRGHGGTAAAEYARAWNFEFECLCEEGVYVSYPDCLEGGEATVGCKYCFKPMRTEYIEPAEAHAYGEEFVTEPTCTADGSVKLICTLCGDSRLLEVLPAAGHRPASVAPVIIPATCTERGMIYHLCSVCGEACGDVYYLPATGHTLSGQTITIEPTCTEEGAYEKACSVCGEIVETGSIPAKGHTPSAGWTILNPSQGGNNGFRVKLCADCGVALEYEYFLAGDLTGDGKVNVKDLTPLKKIISGGKPENVITDNGDINGDGKINTNDLKLFKRLIVGSY